jgi:hypothetical protein
MVIEPSSSRTPVSRLMPQDFVSPLRSIYSYDPMIGCQRKRVGIAEFRPIVGIRVREVLGQGVLRDPPRFVRLVQDHHLLQANLVA